jgi:hypothetical protein
MLRRNIPFAKKAPRKPVRCKEIIPGTNIKCRAELCTTDGEFLYVTFGIREMAMQPKRADNPFLICPECGFETKWRKGSIYGR